MDKKTIITNSGKSVTFTKSKGYFDPKQHTSDELSIMIELGNLLNNNNPFGAIVCHTEVLEDKGYDSKLNYYNNGFVGFQETEAYPIDKARKKLDFYKQLTDMEPQPYFKEYCDAFMITMNGEIIC